MSPPKANPMYTDIWNILKTKGKCKVAAHSAMHRRIIHAVVNKKYYDAVYKFEMSERMTRVILVYSTGHSHILFQLREYPHLQNLSHLRVGDI